MIFIFTTELSKSVCEKRLDIQYLEKHFPNIRQDEKGDFFIFPDPRHGYSMRLSETETGTKIELESYTLRFYQLICWLTGAALLLLFVLTMEQGRIWDAAVPLGVLFLALPTFLYVTERKGQNVILKILMIHLKAIQQFEVRAPMTFQ